MCDSNDDGDWVDDMAETFAVSRGELVPAMDDALTAVISHAARNRDFGDGGCPPTYFGDLAVENLEHRLSATCPDADRLWAAWALNSELRDYGRYTTPDARRRLATELEERTRSAFDSARWQEVCDLLAGYGYFVDPNAYQVLDSRQFGWVSGGFSAHGITVGWNGIGHLRGGRGRAGFDSDWNKVRDALVLLWWPDVDRMGSRRWGEVISTLGDMLDPRSETHRDLLRGDLATMERLATDPEFYRTRSSGRRESPSLRRPATLR